MTGEWRGTSSRRFYEELVWESLYLRRSCNRMYHFFNRKKTATPAYLFDEIPVERYVPYSLRRHLEYLPVNRTERFASTSFQNFLPEWNLLDTNIRDSNTLEVFKNKSLGVLRPINKPVYNVYNIAGIRKLTKFRVNFSALNEHRFQHSFDSLSPRCTCGADNENNLHFFLHCPLYNSLRSDLFSQLADVPGLNIARMKTRELYELFLYRDSNLNLIANRIIIEATILFIERSRRFDISSS